MRLITDLDEVQAVSMNMDQPGLTLSKAAVPAVEVTQAPPCSIYRYPP